MLDTLKEWVTGPAARAAAASYARTYASVMLGFFVADGADILGVTATELRTWQAAALAATLGPLVRALNPNDSAFGRGGGVTVAQPDPEGVDEA